MAIKKSELYNSLWKSCDELRSSILVKLPSLPEQQAIAKILSDMDAEIETLEKKRDKYKTIKQGMMQEFLTGKTRLN
jgi:type I restriction enzyme S subunit